MAVLLEKFKDVLFAVLPITLIVVILHFTFVHLEINILLQFLIGALLVVIGLTVFLFGVDIGITPYGQMVGSKITKTNNIWILAILGLAIGFIITLAEPSVQILGLQIETVTDGNLLSREIVLAVSIGIGIMVMIGLIRTVFDVPLYILLLILYTIVLGLAIFTEQEFIAIAFDASGATTGALSVPFIFALAVGAASAKKDGKKSEKDSFGLVSLASAGAIIAVLILGLFSKNSNLTGHLDIIIGSSDTIMKPFIEVLPTVLLENVIAIAPIALSFLVFQFVWFKMHKRPFRRIVKGLVYVYIGIVIFMTGVQAGFMDVGSILGQVLGNQSFIWWPVIIGFILGVATILAEPAVYVLTNQIEDVTSGYVTRSIVLIALAIGVGLAIALNMVIILVPAFKLWHVLLPGYILAIGLMFITPKLFVGMAFDSGGVASGPMCATFILAFSQGVAFRDASSGSLVDAFGMIALVAFVPIITIEILGIVFKLKSKKEGT